MRNLIFKLMGVLVLLASFAGGWLVLDYRSFLRTPLDVGTDGAIYMVLPGTSLSRLADELAQRGITAHPRYLVWLGRLNGQSHQIQAGEYEIAPGTKPEQLLQMLVAGKVKLHSLTIVEGWTFRELRHAVADDAMLRHTLKGLTGEQVMARLGLPGRHPEGWFFPDTYRFPRGESDVDFLKRAQQAMDRHLQREWKERAADLPLKTPYQALILASIIEKETAMARERERIAGVFVRRLRRGMRLQTDPTVIYGMGTAYDGNIRSRDLKKDTPYNTYTRKGLPPTPIAMPSAASIHAALHPAPGKALYFVAKGDGTHQFSDTLAEHDRAVAKYQLHR
jgi:UPF0755 protein